MRISFYESQILGTREEQQDSLANQILPGGYSLYVLADGMGGQKGGRLASKTVCRVFREFVAEQEDFRTPETLLREALEAANGALTRLLREQPELAGMGTTLIGLLLHGESGAFQYLSVGDSPLYRMQGGNLSRINANHAYAEELKKMVAEGRISEEEALAHPERHAITSAVMGMGIEHVDTGKGVLKPGELLLLASDGIQTLNENPGGEMESLLRQQGGDVETATRALLRAVEEKQHPHQDNTSLILLGAEGEPRPGAGAPLAAKPAKSGFFKWLSGGLVLVFLAGAGFALWRHQAEAEQNALMQAEDARLWQTAEERHTEVAYQDYMAGCRICEKNDEAQRRIDALRKELAEENLKAEELKRLAEENLKAEEAKRLAEEKRKAEEAKRLAEEKRKAEEAKRLAEEKRKAEEAKRLAEEKRKAEEAKRLAAEGQNSGKPNVTSPLISNRYADHGDGTVTDTKTGLQWMRCSLGQSWNGRTCTGSASTYAWKNAVQAAAAQGLAGKAGWRLPTVGELEALIHCGDGERDMGECLMDSDPPHIDKKVFPETQAGFFWSSSDTGYDEAQGVDFIHGDVTYRPAQTRAMVRPVRKP